MRPSEERARRALESLWPGVVVTAHDDGTVNGLWDFQASGVIDAAIEVGEVTVSAVREAAAVWGKKLLDQTSTRLSRQWTLPFMQRVDGTFPRLAKRDLSLVEESLAGLEQSGVIDLGSEPEWDFSNEKGLHIANVHVAALYRVFADEVCLVSSRLTVPGEPGGGWSYMLATGHSSSHVVDDLVGCIEEVLAERADIAKKLARATSPRRLAVLVFDTDTSIGWFLERTEGELPTRKPRLPEGVTDVVLVGPSGDILHFTDGGGWTGQPNSAV